MLSGLLFRKQGAALVPIDDEATAWLLRRKGGDAVVMDPVQVRNAERAALYHVLCGIVAENHEELKTKDAVDDAIRILAGNFEVIAFTPANGKRMFIQRAKSIAFANMKERDFEAFFERALEIIHSQMLPGVDVDSLRKEAYLRSGCEPKKRKKSETSPGA